MNVNTWFNTRYNFKVCGDCRSNDWDAKHVAVHEFGRCRVLQHPTWRFTSVMYPKGGADYTLCNHEKGHIQEIYGAD